MPATGTARIGVSGWRYKSWRADYYPADLVRKDELAWLSRRLDSVEVNGTFYSLQRTSSFRSWYDETPPGFRFSVKGSRFITHMKRLTDPDLALANFFAQGVLALEEKLGPVLWQLPERQRFEPDRLRAFLAALPKDLPSAAGLAGGHDHRVKDPFTEPEGNHRMRHVLEVRHPSFFCDEAVAILRSAGVALAISDAPGWSLKEELTAGFVYIRLHGHSELYRSRYADASLDAWARKIEAWLEGGEPDDAERITDRRPPQRKTRDVYVYFDNDAAGHAPWDAERLRERLGL